jgi:hypothetical protein
MSEETKPATKPGYKTTEFWLTAGAMIMSHLYASGAIGDGGAIAKVAGIVASILAALGYAVVRGKAKA